MSQETLHFISRMKLSQKETLMSFTNFGWILESFPKFGDFVLSASEYLKSAVDSPISGHYPKGRQRRQPSGHLPYPLMVSAKMPYLLYPFHALGNGEPRKDFFLLLVEKVSQSSYLHSIFAYYTNFILKRNKHTGFLTFKLQFLQFRNKIT